MRKSRYSIVIASLGILGLITAVNAQGPAPSAKDENSSSPVILVELFTSEGCSSCPPADALLARIHDKRTASGQLVVGISEHVTYWNHQGWADPYSAETYTERQNGYSWRFNLSSVYTPQMVVNGTEQFVGSSTNYLQDALEKENRPAKATLHILSTSQEQSILRIHFDVAGPGLEKGADIMAVLTDDVDQSNVLRGENRGRELTHVSVARVFSQVAKVHSTSEQSVKLAIPAEMLNDHTRGHHLILFAQAPKLGAVLSADIKPL